MLVVQCLCDDNEDDRLWGQESDLSSQDDCFVYLAMQKKHWPEEEARRLLGQVTIYDGLSPVQSRHLQALLGKYKDVFSDASKKLNAAINATL